MTTTDFGIYAVCLCRTYSTAPWPLTQDAVHSFDWHTADAVQRHGSSRIQRAYRSGRTMVGPTGLALSFDVPNGDLLAANAGDGAGTLLGLAIALNGH